MPREDVIVGKSRFEQFYCVPHDIYDRENQSRRRRTREVNRVPVKELSSLLSQDWPSPVNSVQVGTIYDTAIQIWQHEV